MDAADRVRELEEEDAARAGKPRNRALVNLLTWRGGKRAPQSSSAAAPSVVFDLGAGGTVVARGNGKEEWRVWLAECWPGEGWAQRTPQDVVPIVASLFREMSG